MPPRATTIDETIVATPRRARLARRRAMVRFKNRYLVVEIAHNDGRAMEDARKEKSAAFYKKKQALLAERAKAIASA